MRIFREKDYDGMSRRAADILGAQLLMKPDCVLGLATGSTPVGMYDLASGGYSRGELDFSRAATVNLDEYKGLAPDDPQSYHRFMREHLFSRVNLCPERCYLPDGAAPDPDAECRRYDALLDALGGPDLQVLGIGRNGHIGFNEPSDAFSCGTHCVRLTQSTLEANRRFFAREEDVPRMAYTMGIRNILRAGAVLLLASGGDKAEAVHLAFDGPVTPRVPASALQLHPNVILVGDEAALRLLQRK